MKCDFTGTYSVKFQVKCVDGVAPEKCAVNRPVPLTTTFQFTIDSGYHCPKGIDGVTLTGGLTTSALGYDEQEMLAFLNDETLYVSAFVRSEQAKLYSAEVYKVTIKPSSGSGFTHLYVNDAKTTEGTTTSLDMSQATVTGDAFQLNPKFSFTTVWKNIIDQYNGDIQVEVSMRVVYAGEQSRRRLLADGDVVVDKTSSDQTYSVTVGVQGPSGVTEVDDNASNSVQATVFASSALVLLAMVLA